LSLAFGGQALVTLGRVDEGMAQLDEAMAMVTSGEVGSFMTISEVFCVLLSACSLVGDLSRTEQWCAVATEFAKQYSCFFLSAYCRTTYGGLLTATGRWQAAETELTGAIRAFEKGHHALRIHAALKLADLRIAQGRLEEAEVLLSGYDDYAAAVAPRARLYLARGDALLARAALEQALHSHPALLLEDAPLLSLLIDVLLALDDLDAAREAADSLMNLASHAESDLLVAQAELSRGHTRRRAGRADAIDSYRAALNRLQHHPQSVLAARVRLAIAQTLKSSDWAGAVTWARAARASFDRMGARRDADEAAGLLRELGAPVRAAGERPGQPLTRREAEVLALLAYGLTNREIAERLVISAKTVEHHVGRILDKLGLHSRAEAAAYAALHPTDL
jgi:DNA-binding NarL/FixJ family response regulator